MTPGWLCISCLKQLAGRRSAANCLYKLTLMWSPSTYLSFFNYINQLMKKTVPSYDDFQGPYVLRSPAGAWFPLCPWLEQGTRWHKQKSLPLSLVFAPWSWAPRGKGEKRKKKNVHRKRLPVEEVQTPSSAFKFPFQHCSLLPGPIRISQSRLIFSELPLNASVSDTSVPFPPLGKPALISQAQVSPADPAISFPVPSRKPDLH